MNMNRVSGAAEKLLEGERKALAVRVLTGLESITDLADELGVSRKFVYAQSLRESTALTEAFWVAANDEDKVLFEWVVTPQRLEQLIPWLMLICRAAPRGVMEFLRDVMGWSISIDTVHGIPEAAARRAGDINDAFGDFDLPHRGLDSQPQVFGL